MNQGVAGDLLLSNLEEKMSKLVVGTQPCQCQEPSHAPRLVAITGGPGGGKTAVLEMASRTFCRHVAVLPEAASIVFGGGFPRHASMGGRLAAQRAIFFVQKALEDLVIAEGSVAVALCDRGTIDGLAYWPEEQGDCFESMGSTLETELSRYASVIHLESPPKELGYNHQNALRIESAGEAQRLDEKIQLAWRQHPHRLIVPSTGDFLEKALLALQLIRSELPICCHAHPLQAHDDGQRQTR